MPTTASPNMAYYLNSVRLDDADLVSQLTEQLGASLVAYVAGVRETRAVRQWAGGARQPSPQAARRLRLAFQAAGMITEAGNPPTIVQAWFQGLNPHLEDVAPARTIRDQDPDTIGADLLAAARTFARVG